MVVHTVDACGKTPIFLINAENIKIKNITLKNGDSFIEGGAIMNEGELIICNSNYSIMRPTRMGEPYLIVKN